MKGVFSHEWLQSFFDTPLPSPPEVCGGLMRHAFEVEGVTERGGDTVYELDILPDRSGDCLAHYGIAKEVAAIFSLPMRTRYFEETFAFAREEAYIRTERCDRYAVLKVEGVAAGDIPGEIRRRLEVIGQRSVSPIVDLSNYILFDIGQPVHMFDARKVSGAFGVRQAAAGESLVLLGGETVSLLPDDIVITDGDTPVALAGIMGGESTKVDERTEDVYVEIASFHGATVRRTARRLNCVSDASLRFSQGIPPEYMDYTARYVAEVCGRYGTVTDSSDCMRTRPRRRRMTGVSVREVNAVLGTAYTEDDIRGALSRLLLPYEYADPKVRFSEVLRAQLGKPYVWGASVTRDAPDSFDCSSLVSWAAARAGKSVPRMSVNQCLSSERVEEPLPGDLIFTASDDPAIPCHTERVYEEGFPVSPGVLPEGVNHVAVLTDAGTVIEAEGATGANAVTEKPYDPARTRYVGRLWDGERRFIVTVPVERPDIAHGSDVIEEVGRILGYDTVPDGRTETAAGAESPVNPDLAKRLHIAEHLRALGFSEVMTHSFSGRGEVCVMHPVARDRGCLRVNLRGGLEDALTANAYNGELLGLPDVRIFEIGSVFTKNGEAVHLGIGMKETLGRPKADRERAAREIREALPLPGGFDGAVWEVPLDEIPVTPAEYAVPPVAAIGRYVPPSKYPFVLRDISVFVPDGMTAARTEDAIRRHAGEYLRRVNMFDTFSKDGRMSYAFRLVFQSDTETLGDAAVTAWTDALCAALEKEGFVVR